jgi:predicted Ser/Thr protein kinase
MGTVFLATQLSVSRDVVLKRLSAARGADPASLARFRREAQILARLNHPGIVHLYGLETEGTELYLVMEYVRGPTLGELVAPAPLRPGQAVEVVLELAAALDHAHAQGVVHRDLKPANVLVTPAGQCKVADFGVARMLTGELAGLRTQVGTVLGTPAYISPEAASGQSRIDHRADVYSLGVMAYELLVGRLPFSSPRGDVEAVLEAQVSAAPPAPHVVAPGFPLEVEEVLLRALAKDPRRRPASAGELAEELRRSVQSGFGAGPAPLAAAGADGETGTTPGPAAPTIVRDEAAAPGLQATAVPGPGRAGQAGDATRDPLPELRPVRAGVYRPRRRRSPTGLLALAAVLLLVLAGLVVARTRLAAPSVAPSPLAVTAMSVDVDPPSAVGHCPQATFTFHGQIRTNGAGGHLSYQWRRPDGQLSPIADQPVSARDTQVLETLSFTYQGQGSTSGSAALHVVAPADVYSAPVAVRYVCP